MKLLTVFCWDDIPQLFLQAETIKKFWKGNKHWTIIVEDAGLRKPESIKVANQIKNNLSDWNIEVIIPDSKFKSSGWRRQQLFKLWYSSISDTKWVLVLDCKNFFIRPVSEDMFVSNNTIMSIPVFIDNEFTIESHTVAKLLLGVTANIPMSSCLTPCIINSAESKSLLAHLDIDLDHWIEGQATEFALYQAWTYDKFEYNPVQFVTGFWDEVPVELVDGVMLGAIDNLKFLVWVHHRCVVKEHYRTITKQVLHNVGIPQDVTELWDLRSKDLLDRYANQNRSNWRDI